MTRRALLLAAAGAAASSAAPVDYDINEFSKTYNEWALVVNARAERTGTNGLDRREPLLWNQVKESFKRLRKAFDPIYERR